MKKLTYENITHAKELSIYLEQGNKVLDALAIRTIHRNTRPKSPSRPDAS